MFIIKLILFIASIFVLGLPLVHLWQAIALLLFGIFLIHGKFKFNSTKFAASLIAILILIGIQSFIPKLAIEEGHNLFLPIQEENFPNYNQLPTTIYQSAKQYFYLAYPKKNWCTPGGNSCWYRKNMSPKQTYAFSADSIWQQTKFSRIVDHINFNSLETFRGGFTNNLNEKLGHTNWYDWQSNSIQRKKMPYFMMYQLPETLLGSTLCWQGLVYWPATNNMYKEINNKIFSCKQITQAEIAKQIYGFQISAKQPLTMKLNLPPLWQLKQIISILLCYSILLIVLFNFQFERKPLIYSLAFLGISVVFLLIKNELLPFTGFHILKSGDDGLVYAGYGREIAYFIWQGDWFNALRGSENIFFYMPGMRYVRALCYLIFGDSDLGLLIILLSFYCVLGKLMQMLSSTRVAYFLFIVFLFTEGKRYIYLMQGGWSEVTAYLLFIAGLCQLLLIHKESYQNHLRATYAGLLFAFTLLIRPNSLFGILAAASYPAYFLWKKRALKAFLLGTSALSIASLALIHNWVYGKKLVLFTSSAFIPVNFTTPPSIYVNSLRELITGLTTSSATQHVIEQLTSFITTPYKAICLMLLFVICFKTKRPEIKITSLAALGLFFPHLFWVAHYGRYVALAWLLTYLCVAAAVVNVWNKRFCKLQSCSLDVAQRNPGN